MRNSFACGVSVVDARCREEGEEKEEAMPMYVCMQFSNNKVFRLVWQCTPLILALWR